MIELYNHGKSFFDLLVNHGSMLVDTSISDVIYWLSVNIDIPTWANSFLQALNVALGDWSFAFLVIGEGLIFILVFKIVKFFTDIVL